MFGKTILLMKNIYLIIAVLFVFASCKKEETPTPQNTAPKDTTEKIIQINTSFGTMYMWLYKETPLHRANFLGLADTNFLITQLFIASLPIL
jgi:hypothetical protein